MDAWRKHYSESFLRPPLRMLGSEDEVLKEDLNYFIGLTTNSDLLRITIIQCHRITSLVTI